MYRNFGVAGDPVAVAPQVLKPSVKINRQRWFTPDPDDIVNMLKHTKLLISNHHWCKGHMATDQSDIPVYELGDTAINYCLLGAIRRANFMRPVPRFFATHWRSQRYDKAILVMHRVINCKKCIDCHAQREVAVMNWNDQGNYGEVLAALNRAIVIAPYAEVI